MPITAGIGVGVGIIGGIGKIFSRGSANRHLRELQKQDPTYAANPLVAQRLGLANTILNARSPGAAAAENNIYTNEANAISNNQRGATDSSQFLANAGNVQGATNNAFSQLDQNETADYQRRYGNYVGANEAMVNEGDKVFNDNVRRFDDKAQIQGAQAKNNANSFGDIANMGFGLADFAANGGFKEGGFGSNTTNNNRNNMSGYNTYGWRNIPPITG